MKQKLDHLNTQQIPMRLAARNQIWFERRIEGARESQEPSEIRQRCEKRNLLRKGDRRLRDEIRGDARDEPDKEGGDVMHVRGEAEVKE